MFPRIGSRLLHLSLDWVIIAYLLRLHLGDLAGDAGLLLDMILLDLDFFLTCRTSSDYKHFCQKNGHFLREIGSCREDVDVQNLILFYNFCSQII